MPCLHNGTCIDESHDSVYTFDETGYHCQCMAGYEGKTCESKSLFLSRDEYYQKKTYLQLIKFWANQQADVLMHVRKRTTF